MRKAIIGSLQPEGAADVSRAQPRSRHSVLVSPDQKHDPALVQHCNDKIITPLMRQLGVDGDETFTIPHVDSDGCPNQFDLAAQYRRISTQQNKTGIQMDWSLNFSCHAKGPSDGIGADVKATIHAEQMLDADDRPTRVEDCKRGFDALRRKWTRRACAALRGALRSSCRTTGWTLCDGQCSAATPMPSVCKHSASACKVSANPPCKISSSPLTSCAPFLECPVRKAPRPASELVSQGQERPVHLRSARSRLQEADKSRRRQSE